MRVLLIWPHIADAVLSDELSCCEPLPLEYIAGALRDHHDVTIWDLRLDPPLDTLGEQANPDLIGLAIPYTTAIRSVRALSREARRLWPRATIVLGGHHPSVTSEWLDGFAADFVITGEGGPAMRHLADCLEIGEEPDGYPGLSRFARFRGCTPHRPLPATLDDLPRPDRSTTARHRQRYFHSIYRPVALLRFTAGCPYACTFCSLWKVTGRRYIVKHIDRILEEINEIDVANIYVVDDEAFIQPQRMIALASAIENAGFRKKWHMYVRSDTALRHAAAIERWAAIGLDSVLVGAESMNERDLERYDKGLSPDHTRRAVAFLHSLGVKVRTNFIVSPEFVPDDFDRLAATVRELDIDLPSFSILTPLPGTDLFADTRESFLSDNPDLFDCYHTLLPTRMPLAGFYEEFARLLVRAASRNHQDGRGDAPMFYFSDNTAFDRMISAIRRGHELGRRAWSAS